MIVFPKKSNKLRSRLHAEGFKGIISILCDSNAGRDDVAEILPVHRYSSRIRSSIPHDQDSTVYHSRVCSDNFDNQRQGHDRSVGIKVM